MAASADKHSPPAKAAEIRVILARLPRSVVGNEQPLTVRKSYRVHGAAQGCLVIDSDKPGQTCSIPFSHFRARTRRPNGVSEFQCMGCGRWAALGVYILAHWHEEFVHTCSCGARHAVLRGQVRPEHRAP